MKELLSFFSLMILFPCIAYCQTWHIGTWKIDVDYHNDGILKGDPKAIAFMKDSFTVFEKLQFDITQDQLIYSLNGVITNQVTYSSTIRADGKILITKKNAYGEVQDVIYQIPEGICIENILDRDDWGEFKPFNPLIVCYKN